MVIKNFRHTISFKFKLLTSTSFVDKNKNLLPNVDFVRVLLKEPSYRSLRFCLNTKVFFIFDELKIVGPFPATEFTILLGKALSVIGVHLGIDKLTEITEEFARTDAAGFFLKNKNENNWKGPSTSELLDHDLDAFIKLHIIQGARRDFVLIGIHDFDFDKKKLDYKPDLLYVAYLRYVKKYLRRGEKEILDAREFGFHFKCFCTGLEFQFINRIKKPEGMAISGIKLLYPDNFNFSIFEEDDSLST